MKDDPLVSYLVYLKLSYFREYHQSLAKEAVEKNWTPLDFLSRLVEGEALRRKDRATQRRIQAARFPVIKTLEQFNWACRVRDQADQPILGVPSIIPSAVTGEIAVQVITEVLRALRDKN